LYSSTKVNLLKKINFLKKKTQLLVRVLLFCQKNHFLLSSYLVVAAVVAAVIDAVVADVVAAFVADDAVAAVDTVVVVSRETSSI